MVGLIRELVILALSEVLAEGRVDDARRVFDRVVSKIYTDPGVRDRMWQEVLNGQPSGSNGKYLMWCAKMAADGDVNGPVRAVADFDRLSNRLSPEKRDINRYATTYDLRKSLEPAQEAERAKEDAKVPPGKRVYEGEALTVIRIDSQEQSCKYGSETKWCISGRNSTALRVYTGKRGATFYFFISKDRDPRIDPGAKVAVRLTHEEGKVKSFFYDAKDTKVPRSEAMELVGGEFANGMKAAIADFRVAHSDEMSAEVGAFANNDVLLKFKSQVNEFFRTDYQADDYDPVTVDARTDRWLKLYRYWIAKEPSLREASKASVGSKREIAKLLQQFKIWWERNVGNGAEKCKVWSIVAMKKWNALNSEMKDIVRSSVDNQINMLETQLEHDMDDGNGGTTKYPSYASRWSDGTLERLLVIREELRVMG